MTPTELRTALTTLSLSQRQFARLIGMSDNNVYRFTGGRAAIPVVVELLVRTWVMWPDTVPGPSDRGMPPQDAAASTVVRHSISTRVGGV